MERDLSSRPLNTRRLALAIRRHAVEMTHLGKSSHVGSVLSIADILAVLYGKVMAVDAKQPHWSARDRFILSKGHAGAGVYAALAERGFISREQLRTHYQNGSSLSGHVSSKGIPGVELSTGSLGHGLGVGTGMALAAKRARRSNRVFVLMSDGECDEGSNWEAIMFAAHHKLDNLVVAIDYNNLQSLGLVSNTLALEPFADKWRAFGWHVNEIDGHNHEELQNSLDVVAGERRTPSVVICHTTKGKGVSFMENQVLWHYRSPQGNEYSMACAELDQRSESLGDGDA